MQAITEINQEVLYSVDAQIYTTPKAAAQEFGRSYFAEPRKIRFDADTRTFKMVGGNRTYRVDLINGRLIRGIDGTHLFIVTVKSES